MKLIMIILHLANGEVAKVPVQLAVGEFCSDKVEEIVKYVENSNYKPDNNQSWIHTYYKDKIVFASHCESMDCKYLISWNAGEPCKRKETNAD